MYIGYLLLLLLVSLFYSTCHNNTQTPFTGVNHVDEWLSRQEKTSLKIIAQNINPHGTKRGFFAASLSTYHPNYFYTWTRDAALVARVLSSLPETNDTLLEDYIQFQIDAQNTSTECDCLGEPKFNPDGSSYTDAWGRPQNDGPAERVIAFLSIVKRWQTTGYFDDIWLFDNIIPSITRDLDYIVTVWHQPCFDLWEEINGVHFYTLLVMRRALLDGVDFFAVSQKSVEEYKLAAFLIGKRIESFWSSQHHYIMATQNVQNGVQKPSGLDVSTLLAVNLASGRHDGFFSPGSDKVLATAVALEESFASLYPINSEQSELLGTSIGRYPEDVYDGYDLSVGNPWFIATAAYAELYYLSIEEWKQLGISVNAINKRFFQKMMHDIQEGYYEPKSKTTDQLILRTSQEADKFLATIQYHQARNGSMSEQFDRYIGYMTGARDLTWSHAAFISAVKARDRTPIY